MTLPHFDPLDWFIQRNAELGDIWAPPDLWWDAAQAERDLAFEIHAAQLRGGGPLPYAVHLIETAAFCATGALSEPERFDLRRACAVAWLHDSVEDQEASETALLAVTSRPAYEDILALSKNPQLPKTQAMSDSLRRVKVAGSHAALGKLGDRSSNLLSPPPSYWNESRQLAYRDEGSMILDELGPMGPQWNSEALAGVISRYTVISARPKPF